MSKFKEWVLETYSPKELQEIFMAGIHYKKYVDDVLLYIVCEDDIWGIIREAAHGLGYSTLSYIDMLNVASGKCDMDAGSFRDLMLKQAICKVAEHELMGNNLPEVGKTYFGENL